MTLNGKMLAGLDAKALPGLSISSTPWACGKGELRVGPACRGGYNLEQAKFVMANIGTTNYAMVFEAPMPSFQMSFLALLACTFLLCPTASRK